MNHNEVESRVAQLLSLEPGMSPDAWPDRQELLDHNPSQWAETCELAMERGKDPRQKTMFEIERLRAVCQTLHFNPQTITVCFNRISSCRRDPILAYWFYQAQGYFLHLMGNFMQAMSCYRMLAQCDHDNQYWYARMNLESALTLIVGDFTGAPTLQPAGDGTFAIERARDIVEKNVLSSDQQIELAYRCIVAAWLNGDTSKEWFEASLFRPCPDTTPTDSYSLNRLACAISAMEVGVERNISDLLEMALNTVNPLTRCIIPEWSSYAILLTKQISERLGRPFTMTPFMLSVMDLPGSHAARIVMERAEIAAVQR